MWLFHNTSPRYELVFAHLYGPVSSEEFIGSCPLSLRLLVSVWRARNFPSKIHHTLSLTKMQLFVFFIFSTLARASTTPSITTPASIAGSTCIFDEPGFPTPCSQAGYGCFTSTSCTGECQPSQYSCTSGNNAPCPTGWTCSVYAGCEQTAVSSIPCDGLCAPSTASTPVVPCTVGNNGPCATGSTCTPTVPCTPTALGGSPSCRGQCITTNPPPQFVTVPCVVSASTGCPSYSYCAPTSECIGTCSATGTVLPPTTTYTTMSGPPSSTCQYLNNDCPAGESCSALPVCGGLCLTTAPGITTTCTLGGTCPANAGGGACSSAFPTCTTSGCPGVCSQTPCTVGGTVCPSPQATCTPTEPCSGLCVSGTTLPFH